jgi:Flp pilus assembly pilin Flp
MMDRLLALFISAQTARHDEEGQTVIEYALILAFVAVVALALATGGGIRTGVTNAFTAIGNLFTGGGA